MIEYLECNICNTVYMDKESIDMAKQEAKVWEDLCKVDGVKAKGLYPCPNMSCKGEMVLINK